MAKLKGKTAVITGAGSGIGRATAELFSREGAHVVGLDLNDAVATLQSHGEGTIEGRLGDAADEDVITHLIEDVVARHGRLDIFFANAGIQGKRANLWEQSLEDFNEVLRINLSSVFLAIRSSSMAMAKTGSGSIICTSSIAGFLAYGMTPYSVAKAGVVQLVRNAAHEMAGLNIRVNGIAPGVIETGMNAELFRTWRAGNPEPPVFKTNPLERAGSADEVAEIALFLASDMSSYVNGHTIPADGGWLARANIPDGGSPWRCVLQEGN